MLSEDESYSSSDDLARWDRVAGVYANAIGDSGGSFHRRWAAFLWQQPGDVHGLDILDRGCGHGWLAAQFRETAVLTHPTMLAKDCRPASAGQRK